MPDVQGQVFPAPVFAEFPKVLYAGGSLSGETRTVADADEEAAAVAEGFAFTGTEHTPEPELEPESAAIDPAGDETTAAPEGEETVGGVDPVDVIAPVSGADA